jgi:CHASE3 domain sensor protein
MNRDLDQIVDICFTRMQTDSWSVEQCLDAYPEYREVLKPLLVLGYEMQFYLSPGSPSSEFIRNSAIRIQNKLRSRIAAEQRRSTHRVNKRAKWFLRPAYVLAVLTLVISLLASGVGVVSASAASLPGDALYPIKMAREQVALSLSFSNEGDEALLTEFAEERLNEAEALIEQHRLEDLPTALAGFDSALDQLNALVNETGDQQPGSLEHLQARLDKHIEVLHQVMEKAPEQAQEALQNAIEKSSHSRDVIESVRGGGQPSDNAPGQNKPVEKDKDKDNNTEDANPGQGNGPKPKEEKQNGPPPWANNK